MTQLTHAQLVMVEQLRVLREEQAWGYAHPYAGVCGEDDARADAIEGLERALAGEPPCDCCPPFPDTDGGIVSSYDS
jgi:hypothetical protein